MLTKLAIATVILISLSGCYTSGRIERMRVEVVGDPTMELIAFILVVVLAAVLWIGLAIHHRLT